MRRRAVKANALILGALVAFMPALSFAATDTQLVPLYQQLVTVLKNELLVLAPDPVLSIEPGTGHAPFTAIFTLSSLTKTDAINFGDGHTTGTLGCPRNALGFCDLHAQFVHTYLFPDTYTISQYRSIGKEQLLVSTTTLTVSPAVTATTSTTLQ